MKTLFTYYYRLVVVAHVEFPNFKHKSTFDDKNSRKHSRRRILYSTDSRAAFECRELLEVRLYIRLHIFIISQPRHCCNRLLFENIIVVFSLYYDYNNFFFFYFSSPSCSSSCLKQTCFLYLYYTYGWFYTWLNLFRCFFLFRGKCYSESVRSCGIFCVPVQSLSCVFHIECSVT